jgi:hypothetical protein
MKRYALSFLLATFVVLVSLGLHRSLMAVNGSAEWMPAPGIVVAPPASVPAQPDVAVAPSQPATHVDVAIGMMPPPLPPPKATSSLDQVAIGMMPPPLPPPKEALS